MRQISTLFLAIFCIPLFVLGQERKANPDVSDPILMKKWQEVGSPLRSFNPFHEEIDSRTQTAKFFRNNEGEKIAIIGAGPIHYQENGTWKTLANDIMPNNSGIFSDFSHINQWNEFTTFYKENKAEVKVKLQDGTFLSHKPLAMEWLNELGDNLGSVSLNGTALPEDESMNFANIAQNVDLTIRQLTIGFETDYRLKDISILNNKPLDADYLAFVEEIEIPAGYNVVHNFQEKETNNAISSISLLKNGIERVRYNVPQFYDEGNIVWQAERVSAKQIKGTYFYTINGNILTIKILVPIAWLAAADRTYPVIIDPVINITPSNSTYWTGTVYDDGSKDLAFNDGMRVGHEDLTWPSNNKYFQTFAKMDLTSIPDNACITSANFYMYQTSMFDGSGCDEIKFRVGRTTTDPIPDPWTTVYTSVDALATEYSRWDVYGTSCGAGCQDYNQVSSQWKTFPMGATGSTDVKNRLVANWITIGIDNLLAYDNNCSGAWDDSGWINWAGYSSANRPYMVVNYSDNDLCAAATPVTSGNSYTFTTTCAAQDGPTPSCGTGVNKEVWFSFVAPSTGTLTLSTCNAATYDTRLTVFTGACGAFTEVGCNDDYSGCNTSTSQVSVPVTSGTTYRIAVGGYNGASGTGTLNVTYYAPPPIGSLQIGDLIISATTITNTGVGTYTCSGNVRIMKLGCGNNVLYFSTNINVNLNTNTISSSGLCNIYVPNVYSGGVKQDIYYGPFSCIVSVNILNFANNSLLNTLFKLADLDVKIDNFAVLCDRVNINGNLNLPDILSTYNNGSLQANVNLVQVVQNGGIDFAATLHLANVKLYKKVLLNYLDIVYDGPNDYFQGATKLTTPMMAIDGATEVDSGVINYITLGVTFAQPQPIGTTGLSILSATGAVRHINDPYLPLLFQLGGTFVPTVTGSLTSISNLQLNLEYELGNYFAADGTVNLFNSSVGNAGFKVWSNRFDAYGNVTLIALLHAYANFSIWKNPGQPIDLSGEFGGSVKMPNPSTINNVYLRWILSNTFAQGQVIATSDNYLRKAFLTGHAKINSNWLPRFSYLLNWGGGLSANIGLNYNAIPLSIRQQYGLGIRLASANAVAPGNYGFNLGKSCPELVIDAQYSGGIPSFSIVTPDGDSITTANATSFPYITYQESAIDGFCYMKINNPKLGDYEVTIISADSFHISRVNTPPSIAFDNVIVNGATKTVTANWTDADPDDNAQIALFLDNDAKGGDGILLVDGISEDSNVNTYSFNYGTMKTGDYYLYAVITDSAAQFRQAYKRNKMRFITNNAPNTPTNLTVVQTDSSLRFSFWRTNWGANRTNYLLYYAVNGVVSFTSPSLAVGDTNFYEFMHFQPGKMYQFGVSAIDTLNRESDMSNIITIVYTSPIRNDAPTIDKSNINTRAFANTAYPQTIVASDPENNPLIYTLKQAPAGMSIAANGQITWTPSAAQLGYQVVEVRVSDGMYADSILYQINVMNNNLRASYIEFNKYVYIDYGDKGMVSLTDPDLATSDVNIDSMTLLLSSNTSPAGISIKVYETDPNSHTFVGIFSLSGTTNALNQLHVTYGDTIFAKYNDVSMGTITQNIAYLTHFLADFSKNTVQYCGDTVFFHNLSKGDNLSYNWDFGDGTSSNLRHPYHVYTASGIYNVTLNITDPNGRMAAKTLSTDYTCLIFPVEWLDISATTLEEDVNIDWKVSAERNLHHYEVQKANPNQTTFTTIKQVTPFVSTAHEVSYQYKDVNAFVNTNKLYYRIKSVDISGEESYSQVAIVTKENGLKAWAAHIYPNPIAAGKDLTIHFSNGSETNIKASFWNTNGNKVAETVFETNMNTQQVMLPIPKEMASGIYLLRMIDDNANTVTVKVTVE